MMKLKGRVQEDADADLTIFDSDKIIDQSTFENGLKFSDGIQFVLVNGVLNFLYNFRDYVRFRLCSA